MVLVNKNSVVEAAPGDEGDIQIDFEYIYNITKRLSFIINDTTIYPPGTLAKGRAFGTDGEHWAAKFIIKDTMENDIGLWNVTLENITQFPDDTIDDKLEVLAKGITVNNTAANDTKFIVDCYIDPALNESP